MVPEGSKETPRTASLFKSMALDTVTLERGAAAAHPAAPVGHGPGRRGDHGAERPVRAVHQAGHGLPLAGERGAAVHRHPGRGAGAASPSRSSGAPGRGQPPLQELGDDPVTRSQVIVKEGRFGPYVTDGETNASLRKGDDVEALTIERAAELLADRRERAPVKKKAAKKAAAKKAPAKKATAKKATAKKTTTKKAAAVADVAEPVSAGS